MKIKLFINKKKENKFIFNIIEKELKGNDIEITDGSDYDIGIAIGGDGTFLHMITYNNFKSDALYVGINNGTLGFLQEVKPNEIKKLINSIKNKEYKVEELSYERVTVITEKDEINYNALNEVVIRDTSLRTAYLDVLVDNSLLENYVGDGIMVSTPTGSTSYSLSCNGAICYSGLNVLEITPLAPINNYIFHTLKNSVIVPDDKVIETVPTGRTKDLSIFIDGINYTHKNVKKIITKINEDKLKVIRLKDRDYTSIIFNKFLK